MLKNKKILYILIAGIAGILLIIMFSNGNVKNVKPKEKRQISKTEKKILDAYKFSINTPLKTDFNTFTSLKIYQKIKEKIDKQKKYLLKIYSPKLCKTKPKKGKIFSLLPYSYDKNGLKVICNGQGNLIKLKTKITGYWTPYQKHYLIRLIKNLKKKDFQFYESVTFYPNGDIKTGNIALIQNNRKIININFYIFLNDFVSFKYKWKNNYMVYKDNFGENEFIIYIYQATPSGKIQKGFKYIYVLKNGKYHLIKKTKLMGGFSFF